MQPDPHWPALPLEPWQDTKQALHLYLQVIGKVRMALHPKQNHWWHVTLRAGPRGFTTGPIPIDERSLELDAEQVEARAMLDRLNGVTPSTDGDPDQ